MLLHQAVTIADLDSLTQELQCLRQVFLMNAFKIGDIKSAMNQVLNDQKKKDDIQTEQVENRIVLLSYCGAVSSQVGLRPIYHPLNELQDWMLPVKHHRGFHTPSIYRIP